MASWAYIISTCRLWGLKSNNRTKQHNHWPRVYQRPGGCNSNRQHPALRWWIWPITTKIIKCYTNKRLKHWKLTTKKPTGSSSLAQGRTDTKRKKNWSASSWRATWSKAERDQAWLHADIHIHECSRSLERKLNCKISRTKCLQNLKMGKRYQNSSRSSKISSWRQAWAICKQMLIWSRVNSTACSHNEQTGCWARRTGATSQLRIQMLKLPWTETREMMTRTQLPKEAHHIQVIDGMALGMVTARNRWARAYRGRTHCPHSWTIHWNSWMMTWPSPSTHQCEEYKNPWLKKAWRMTLPRTRAKSIGWFSKTKWYITIIKWIKINMMPKAATSPTEIAKDRQEASRTSLPSWTRMKAFSKSGKTLTTLITCWLWRTKIPTPTRRWRSDNLIHRAIKITEWDQVS